MGQVRIGILDLTIAISTTTSGAVAIHEYKAGFFQVPAAFTGASVTFLVAEKLAGTFVELRDANNAVETVTVAASGTYEVPASVFNGGAFKIVSASSEAAARTIKCFFKP